MSSLDSSGNSCLITIIVIISAIGLFFFVVALVVCLLIFLWMLITDPMSIIQEMRETPPLREWWLVTPFYILLPMGMVGWMKGR